MVRTRSRTARRSALAVSAVVAGAGLVAFPAGPAQAAASTTVGPAGHSYTAALVPGTTATFLVGSTTVTCNQSVNNGAVPAEPANTSTDGPVVSALTPATFTNNGGACPTNVLFTTARTVSNSTNGDWTIALQYDQAGSVGTMTIPQAGVVTTISGLASCVVTVAPDGPASFSGPWVPGTESSPPVLDFSAGVSLPIRVTGGLTCPTGATTARFTARYAVTDTTDATQQITVSAAAPVPTEPTASEPTPSEPTPTDPTPTDPTPTDPTPTDPTPTDPVPTPSE
jgi:YD repeat-containing protein